MKIQVIKQSAEFDPEKAIAYVHASAERRGFVVKRNNGRLEIYADGDEVWLREMIEWLSKKGAKVRKHEDSES